MWQQPYKEIMFVLKIIINLQAVLCKHRVSDALKQDVKNSHINSILGLSLCVLYGASDKRQNIFTWEF